MTGKHRMWAFLGVLGSVVVAVHATGAMPAHRGGAARSGFASPATPTAAEVRGCPVTPYTAERLWDGFTTTWYGSDGLMAGRGPATPGVWFAAPAVNKVQWRRPAGERLTVEGNRLDAPAATLEVNLSVGYERADFQSSTLTFPTEGCWEVVAHTPDRELRFVVYVHPGREYPVGHRGTPTAQGGFDALRRPLSPPSGGEARACPRTPVHTIPRVLGATVGDGPVYAQGLGIDGIVELGGDQGAGGRTTLPVAVRWVASPDYVGPLLFRLRRLAGGVQGASDESAVLLEATEEGLDNLTTPDWRVWAWPPDTIPVPGPGCFAIQIDGQDFSETIVFQIVVPGTG
jgi:hypothetical protein